MLGREVVQSVAFQFDEIVLAVFFLFFYGEQMILLGCPPDFKTCIYLLSVCV